MLPSEPPQVPSRPLLRHLLCDVATLPRSVLPPGKGHLSISVLFSPPRQHKSLYPWAHLDDARAIAAGSKPFPPNRDVVQTWEEMVFFHAEWRSDDDDPDDARMICAIEGYNYTLPQHGSGVFYLSKIDTTGYSPRLNNPRTASHLAKHDVPFLPSDPANTKFQPSSASSSTSPNTAPSQPSSLTTHLTISFLNYFLRLSHQPALPVPSRPLRHMSIHILARAQGAYLFPNSPDHPRKKPLSDVKLIVWWREVLSRVIQGVKAREWDAHIDARYLIPGLDAFESHPLVPLPPKGGTSALARAGWKYGHPYSLQGAGVSKVEDLPPLPLHLDPSKDLRRSLATLIPRFEDDPQSRFLDELSDEGQEPGRFADVFLVRGREATTEHKVPPTTNASSQSLTDNPAAETTGSQRSHLKRKSPGDGDAPTSPRKSQRASVDAKSPLPSSTSTTPAFVRDASTPGKTSSRAPSPSDVRRSPRKSTAVVTAASIALEQQRPPSPIKSQRVTRSSSGAGVGPQAQRLASTQIATIRSRLALDDVSPDEFWIRMGYRQECSSGNLVGAFFLSATYDRYAEAEEQEEEEEEEEEEAKTVSEPASAAIPTPKSTPLLIPAQPRPRFTIPLPSLYKSMRKYLQLDDCYWNKERESIELTQEFDEQRGRLLLQFGSLAEHEKTPSESGYDEDIDITLHSVRGITAGAASGASRGGRLVRKTRNRRNNSKPTTTTTSDAPAPAPAPAQQRSPSEAAEEARMQTEYLVGKGVVWQTVPLVGYDDEMVQDAAAMAAQEKEQEQSQNNSQTGSAAAAPAGVTMLTVKRRKKRE